MNICLHEFEVKGILDRTISELWRPILIAFLPGYNSEWTGYQPIFEYGKFYLANSKGEPATKEIKLPFGLIGTRIVGKEPWCNQWGEDNSRFNDKYFYKADGIEVVDVDTIFKSPWVSPILMPIVASRITLINAGVECKRVRDITEEEAKAAGMAIDEDPYWIPTCNDPDSGGHPLYQKSFQYVWDYFYDKKGYPFESAYGWKLKFESEVKR